MSTPGPVGEPLRDDAAPSRRWIRPVLRVLAAAASVGMLCVAFFSLALASCHDSGGFCAGDKTASDAREAAGSTSVSVALAGLLATAAFAVPRRRWLLAGMVVGLLSVAAGVVAYEV